MYKKFKNRLQSQAVAGAGSRDSQEPITGQYTLTYLNISSFLQPYSFLFSFLIFYN